MLSQNAKGELRSVDPIDSFLEELMPHPLLLRSWHLFFSGSSFSRLLRTLVLFVVFLLLRGPLRRIDCGVAIVLHARPGPAHAVQNSDFFLHMLFLCDADFFWSKLPLPRMRPISAIS